MTTSRERSGAAAVRLLAAHADIDLLDLELAAWTAAKAGLEPVAMPDAKEDLHVRQAAAFGAGNDDAAFALLAQQVAGGPGDRLLFHACHLVGDRCADRLLEIAERDLEVWFRGPMLVRTRDPLRLLALVDADDRREHVVATVCELLIRGRDTGTRVPEVEQRWAEMNVAGKGASGISRYRDAELRLAAREAMEHAILRMEDLAASWGYDGQDAGTEAVLGRLVQTDPIRACEIVARREQPTNRISWLAPLLRWCVLPSTAEAIIDSLLALTPLPDPIVLARLMVLARSTDRLEHLLPQIAHTSPFEIASRIGSALARLRDAGLHDDAEAARARVLTVVGNPAARDLLDVLGAPELPPLVPWVPDPGIP